MEQSEMDFAKTIREHCHLGVLRTSTNQVMDRNIEKKEKEKQDQIGKRSTPGYIKKCV